MGLIKEPNGVDFIIESKQLTKEQEAELGEFIAKRKREIAEMKKHELLTKAKSRQTESVKRSIKTNNNPIHEIAMAPRHPNEDECKPMAYSMWPLKNKLYTHELNVPTEALHA